MSSLYERERRRRIVWSSSMNMGERSTPTSGMASWGAASQANQVGEVQDFLPSEESRAGHGAIGNAVIFQRLLEEVQVGQATKQDGDVRGGGLPRLAKTGVPDKSAVPQQLGDFAGHQIRLHPALAVFRSPLAVGRLFRNLHHCHRRRAGRVSPRAAHHFHWRLVILLGVPQHVSKKAVQPLHKGIVGTEGLAQTVEAAVPFHLSLKPSEAANVAAPKAVYGLLGVADEEGFEAALPAQKAQQLNLGGIGVLKLVDHDVLEPAAITLCDVLVAAQKLPGPDFKVEIIQAAKPVLVLPVTGAGVREQTRAGQPTPVGRGRRSRSIGEDSRIPRPGRGESAMSP